MKETKETVQKINDSLTLTCMKHNMIEFIDEWGYVEADMRLARLFGDAYTNVKEELYQWYDLEISGECKNVK
jgi:hypothetical protein|tara:strand:- start:1778 stop:1993 length:216 start_codon:yes stop_codon:yes gene_type:complete